MRKTIDGTFLHRNNLFIILSPKGHGCQYVGKTKSTYPSWKVLIISGAGKGVRTLDTRLGKPVL
ncbi:MAG TPA: hypothetical protein PK317_06870, partial [Coprothermobacter proteolyticus]|nr:hypothetical protein [Coprothermobacter proteolyticus]